LCSPRRRKTDDSRTSRRGEIPRLRFASLGMTQGWDIGSARIKSGIFHCRLPSADCRLAPTPEVGSRCARPDAPASGRVRRRSGVIGGSRPLLRSPTLERGHLRPDAGASGRARGRSRSPSVGVPYSLVLVVVLVVVVDFFLPWGKAVQNGKRSGRLPAPLRVAHPGRSVASRMQEIDDEDDDDDEHDPAADWPRPRR